MRERALKVVLVGVIFLLGATLGIFLLLASRGDVPALVVVGVALIALAPAKQSA
jgi:hypothetical protein